MARVLNYDILLLMSVGILKPMINYIIIVLRPVHPTSTDIYCYRSINKTFMLFDLLYPYVGRFDLHFIVFIESN